jgi:hypothetical protein
MDRKHLLATAAAALILAAQTTASFAAGEFEGVWKVTDSGGKPFEITLSAGGKASADRPAKPMTGTWKEAGSGVVITWNTGWTTKISKDGGKFTKTAFEKGKTDKPVDTSPAEKVK